MAAGLLFTSLAQANTPNAPVSANQRIISGSIAGGYQFQIASDKNSYAAGTPVYECVQANLSKQRACNSALLFLIYPLGVVNGEMATRIIDDVRAHLQSERGIRQYLGDSFWCADYRELQDASMRTADVSADMSSRNALLKPGEKGLCCIFDPILSAYYGQRYAENGEPCFLEKQIVHFNRSLDQLTQPGSGFEACLCPELYYLERSRYVPNDVTPLLWTQANLGLAFDQMEHNAGSLQRISAAAAASK